MLLAYYTRDLRKWAVNVLYGLAFDKMGYKAFLIFAYIVHKHISMYNYHFFYNTTSNWY
jgi:hypothetical protein